MLRLHGLDIRWGGPSRSGSEPSSPPTADAALGSEIEVASARLADTSSAGSVVASADERERDRGMHARGRLVRPPTAEHLEMSGHAVAKRDLEALRARAPVGRIETIDRRALTHDRPRGRELAECQRQSSL